MTLTPRLSKPARSAKRAAVPMLRWPFTRESAVLTCEIDANPTGGYDVCLVPHWDVSAAAIERIDGAVPAIERHVELGGLPSTPQSALAKATLPARDHPVHCPNRRVPPAICPSASPAQIQAPRSPRCGRGRGE